MHRALATIQMEPYILLIVMKPLNGLESNTYHNKHYWQILNVYLTRITTRQTSSYLPSSSISTATTTKTSSAIVIIIPPTSHWRHPTRTTAPEITTHPATPDNNTTKHLAHNRLTFLTSIYLPVSPG